MNQFYDNKLSRYNGECDFPFYYNCFAFNQDLMRLINFFCNFENDISTINVIKNPLNNGNTNTPQNYTKTGIVV